MSAGATPAPTTLLPLDRFEWERVIRRVPLGKTAKLVALTLATYADRNGQNAHPGVERLAAEVEADERTVRRALTKLRELGLILQTHDGSSSGRRKLASEYRLTQPVDLLQRVTLLPNPATDHRAAVPGDETSDHRAPLSAVLPDHRAAVPADLTGITGQQCPDHRAGVTDHRAAVSGSPGTAARPPTMTTDEDHNRDHAATTLDVVSPDARGRLREAVTPHLPAAVRGEVESSVSFGDVLDRLAADGYDAGVLVERVKAERWAVNVTAGGVVTRLSKYPPRGRCPLHPSDDRASCRGCAADRKAAS